MKQFKYVSFLAVIFALCSGTIALAQSRSASRQVVPFGWENEDSIRFGTFDQNGKDASFQDSLDHLDVNFQDEYGSIRYSDTTRGKRKGIVAYGWHCGEVNDLTGSAYSYQQRTFFPSPKPIGYWFDPGYSWRYIDPNYTWHDNQYDANDISPYAEFLKNSDIVSETYETRKIDIGW